MLVVIFFSFLLVIDFSSKNETNFSHVNTWRISISVPMVGDLDDHY